MRLLRSSTRMDAVDMLLRKLSIAVVPLSLAYFLWGLAGCRTPTNKNVSDTFVSTCTITPEVLQAHSCVNFQKSNLYNCFLSLHGYSAPQTTLEAAGTDLKKFGDVFGGIIQEYDRNVKKMEGILEPNEARSLSFYTSVGYRYMNRALRGDVELFKDYSNLIFSAASGLNKLKTFEGIVQRSENLELKNLSDIERTYKVGNIVIEEAFLSTTTRDTLNWTRPSNELHMTYTIQSKTGRNVEDVSSFPSEKEVLFIPGTAFRVLSFKKVIEEVPPQPFIGVRAIPTRATVTVLKVEMEEIE